MVCAILFVIYEFGRPKPHPSIGPDILCSYVSDALGMKCVALLGSDAILGPGAVVEYPVQSQARAPVPLPNAQLFSSTCVVPGAKIDALTSSLHNQQNTIALESMKFHSDRNLQTGAELPTLDFRTSKSRPAPKPAPSRTLP
jgi:hypothetical protein